MANATYFFLVIFYLFHCICLATLIDDPTAVELFVTPELTDVQGLLDGLDSGTKLILGPGTYSGFCGVTIQKDLHLQGHGGQLQTLLDCRSQSRHLRIIGPVSVTVDGLSFINGTDNRGGCLLVEAGADVRINQTNFVDCHGGMQVDSFGGAVHAENSSLYISRASVTQASAKIGGAFYLSRSTVVVEGEVVFTDCSATGDGRGGGMGGMAYMWQSNLTVSNNVIVQRCRAENGGMVYLEESNMEAKGDISVRDCLAEINGGMAYLVRSSLGLFDGVTVQETVAQRKFLEGDHPKICLGECKKEGWGGFAFLQRGSTLTARHTVVVKDSHAWKSGGCVYLGVGCIMVAEGEVSFTGCKSGAKGGFAYVDGDVAVAQGFAYVDGDVAVVDPRDHYPTTKLVLQEGVKILQCSSLGSHGGAMFILEAKVIIRNNVKILECWSAKNGGSFYVDGGGHLDLSDNVEVEQSWAGLHGGVSYLRGSTLVAKRNVTLRENQAGEGGGVVYLTSGSAFVAEDDVLIAGCSAKLNGGMAYVNDSLLVLSRAKIEGCLSHSQGGVVYMGQGILMAADVAVHNCSASGAGGFLFLSGGVANLEGVDVQNCHATKVQGMETFISQAGNGGVVFVDGVESAMEVRRMTVRDCHAEGSGGFAYIYGGKIELSGRTHIQQCSAKRGGALAVREGLLKIMGTEAEVTVQDCDALEYGGMAVIVDGTVDATGLKVEQCRALVHGGAVFVSGFDARLLVTDTEFRNCHATNRGGAIALESNATAEVWGRVVLEYNTAAYGAGLNVDGATFHLLNGTLDINHNHASVQGGGINAASSLVNLREGRTRLQFNHAASGGGFCGVGASARLQMGWGHSLQILNCTAELDGAGMALLATARMDIVPAEITSKQCPSSCSESRDQCQPECLTLACNFGQGKCSERFMEAGDDALSECSISDCTRAGCNWGEGDPQCKNTFDQLGSCPVFDAVAYHSLVRQPLIKYIGKMKMPMHGTLEKTLAFRCLGKNFTTEVCQQKLNQSGGEYMDGKNWSDCKLVKGYLVEPDGETLTHSNSSNSVFFPPSTSPVPPAWCGGHWADNCSDCPQGHGEYWCNGDCVWRDGQCILLPDPGVTPALPEIPGVLPILPDPPGVWCGGHAAESCGDCPEGNGANWCNGDCTWVDGQCTQAKRDLIGAGRKLSPFPDAIRSQEHLFCSEKPWLPVSGFRYQESDMQAIAALSVDELLSLYPGCGLLPLTIRGNEAGRNGGGIFEEACRATDTGKSCVAGGITVGSEFAAQIVVADNSARESGGGLFSQCSGDLEACSKLTAVSLGLPMLSLGLPTLRAGGTDTAILSLNHNHAYGYGADMGGLPTRLMVITRCTRYVPGRDVIDLNIFLRDVRGHDIMPGAVDLPYVIRVHVQSGLTSSNVSGPSLVSVIESFAVIRPTSTPLRTAEFGYVLPACPLNPTNLVLVVSVSGGGLDSKLQQTTTIECLPCPEGYSLEHGVNDWGCHKCRDTEYIINSNLATHMCNMCPPGLRCFGNSTVVAVDAHAVWAEEFEGVLVLKQCPSGHEVYPEPGKTRTACQTADCVQSWSSAQQCNVCGAGHECTAELCDKCSPCAPGTHKPEEGANACSSCPADTYTDERGARDCFACPAKTSTRNLTQQTESGACVCAHDHYAIVDAERLECIQCPEGAMDTDGFCMLGGVNKHEENSLWHASGLIGEWKAEAGTGHWMLHGCPQGHELVSMDEAGSEELQACKACSVEHYILNPNVDECQKCPPGLVCRGTEEVVPVVNGSTWVVDGQLYRLVQCPTGYAVVPPHTQLFDPHLQLCESCGRGEECTLKECTECSLCKPGFHKDFVGTDACLACPANTFRGLHGATELEACLQCQSKATTKGLTGQTSKTACVCDDDHFAEVGIPDGACVKCPNGALCEATGECLLRHWPDTNVTCDGVKGLKGSWEVDSVTGTFWLQSCPRGFTLSQDQQACIPSLMVVITVRLTTTLEKFTPDMRAQYVRTLAEELQVLLEKVHIAKVTEVHVNRADSEVESRRSQHQFSAIDIETQVAAEDMSVARALASKAQASKDKLAQALTDTLGVEVLDLEAELLVVEQPERESSEAGLVNGGDDDRGAVLSNGSIIYLVVGCVVGIAILGSGMWAYKGRKKAAGSRAGGIVGEMYPRNVAQALMQGEKVLEDRSDSCAVFFSDIVGFTDLSSKLTAVQVNDMLNRLFEKLDNLAIFHGVYKIDTIGDCYIGVTHLVQEQAHQSKCQVKRMACFSLDAIKAAEDTLIDPNDAPLGGVKIRVGFDVGQVVGNLQGTNKRKYTISGTAANTASRMESTGVAMKVQCTARAAQMLREQDPSFRLTSRGEIEVNGRGFMETFFVDRRDDSKRVSDCCSKQSRKRARDDDDGVAVAGLELSSAPNGSPGPVLEPAVPTLNESERGMQAGSGGGTKPDLPFRSPSTCAMDFGVEFPAHITAAPALLQFEAAEEGKGVLGDSFWKELPERADPTTPSELFVKAQLPVVYGSLVACASGQTSTRRFCNNGETTGASSGPSGPPSGSFITENIHFGT